MSISSRESSAAQTSAAGSGDFTRGLRLVLLAGFGGMLLIFVAAAVDAIHVLHTLRAESSFLRQASLERSRNLASVRTYVLLSHTYLSEYLIEPADARSLALKAQLQGARSEMLSALGRYRNCTARDAASVQRLQDLLGRHWQNLARALSLPPSERRREGMSFYSGEMLPLRTTVLEIAATVDKADAAQLASTEAEIQNRFERMGGRLSLLLNIALAAALLLAVGCIVYILRIERQNRRRYGQILHARGALQQLSAKLVDAQETERRTISRELHDQVGQTLNALLVDAANLAGRLPPDDDASRRYLDNIRAFADSSVNSIRDIALLLRPSMLDDLGLIPALEWQAREVSRRSGIKVKVAADGVPDALDDALRTCLYRLVQEALHNVSRHSGARNATVTVRRQGESLAVSIEDDGAGFDATNTKGLGLLGMEERVHQFGGNLQIESQPGKGTVLRATLPVAVPVTE
ncbi:MAG: sensor histidine kinase [Bryobacteraceae bacterium]